MRATLAAGAAALLAAITAAQTGEHRKRGGILRVCTPDSPAGMSVPRGGGGLLAGPDVSMQSVVPDLATF